MKKEYRIKKAREIDCVFNKKKSSGNDSFVIYISDSGNEHFRYSISIGRKYGNAVSRNLCKRRIREIVHANKDYITNKDLVIVVKKDASKLSYKMMKTKIEELLVKLKLMERKDEKE